MECPECGSANITEEHPFTQPWGPQNVVKNWLCHDCGFVTLEFEDRLEWPLEGD